MHVLYMDHEVSPVQIVIGIIRKMGRMVAQWTYLNVDALFSAWQLSRLHKSHLSQVQWPKYKLYLMTDHSHMRLYPRPSRKSCIELDGDMIMVTRRRREVP